MNDREKENQPGTPEEEKKGASPAPDGEDLNRELEQLRDIFQKELDEQTAQPPRKAISRRAGKKAYRKMTEKRNIPVSATGIA